MCKTFKWIKLLVIESQKDDLQIPLKMNKLPVIGYPCLREELWDRQGANIASR